MNFKHLSNRINLLKSLQAIIAILILWTYNIKMLNPTVDSISSMSRSFIVDGVQQNPAYYPTTTLSSVILMVFLFFLFLFFSLPSSFLVSSSSFFLPLLLFSSLLLLLYFAPWNLLFLGALRGLISSGFP